MMLSPRDAVHETGRDASNVSRRILQTQTVCQRVSPRQPLPQQQTNPNSAAFRRFQKQQHTFQKRSNQTWKRGDVI